jgi:hypothetical protein
MDQFDPLAAAIEMHAGDPSESVVMAKQQLILMQLRDVVRRLVEGNEVLVYSSIYISPIERNENDVIPAAVGAYMHHRPGESWDEIFDLFGVLTVDSLKDMLSVTMDRPKRGEVDQSDEALIVDLYRVRAILEKYGTRAATLLDNLHELIKDVRRGGLDK